MSNKTRVFLIYAVAGLITVLLAGGALFYSRQTSAPSLQEIQAAKERALGKVLADPQGNPMISPDSVQSYLLADTATYRIVYQKAFDTFYVGIGEPPFEQVRKEAELAFLKLLEADESVACELQVRVTAGPAANPGHAGEYYPLSFCENNGQ